MKSLLTPLLLALSLALPAQANPLLQLAGSPPVVVAPTYLLSADGDSGTGWTDTETVEWNDTDSPAPILGSGGSVRVGPSSNTFENFGDRNEAWGFFAVKASTQVKGARMFSLRNNIGNSTAMYIQYFGTGTADIQVVGGSTSATTVATFADATLLYVWWHYVKDTGGTEEVLEIWVSETTTKPADGSNNHAKATDHGATVSAGGLQLQCSNATPTHYFQKIRVDDEAIGSNPP